MKKIFLDQGETALEEEIEKGRWVAVPDMAREIKRYQENARRMQNKNKKINIRLSDWDYHRMKITAAREGLPYQTLLSSLIHKYLTGQLKPG